MQIWITKWLLHSIFFVGAVVHVALLVQMALYSTILMIKTQWLMLHFDIGKNSWTMIAETPCRFVYSIFQHVLGERLCNVNSGLSTGCSDDDQTLIRNANLSEHAVYEGWNITGSIINEGHNVVKQRGIV